jgi:5-methylcytosine-specific restriction protein A
MSRKEFPKAVRVAVIKRATHRVEGTNEDVQICENPTCRAIAKRFQIDHIDPDGLTGKPVIENAMLICEPCWKIKNPIDTSNIAKAKRREAIALGAKQPSGKLQGPQFPKKPAREPKAQLPRTQVCGQPI